MRSNLTMEVKLKSKHKWMKKSPGKDGVAAVV
jgi:hypothetical protein